MSKLRIRLSENKAFDLSVPEVKRNEIPLLVLNMTQLVSVGVFAFLFVRTTFLAHVQYTELFELLVSLIIVLLALQTVKALLGGIGSFPESRFDLPGLLLSIGLISTLLLKQVLDLEGNEGMLPNQSAWHYTILGLLLMSLLGYLFDISFRKRFYSKSLMFILLGVLEILTIGKYIIDGDVLVANAFLVLLLLPVFMAYSFDIKNFYVRAVYFVNLTLLGLLAFLNLDLVYAFVYLIGLLIMLVIGFMRGDYSFEGIRQIVQYKKGVLRFSFAKNAIYGLLNILVFVVLGLTVILNLLFSERTLEIARTGLEDNLEVFRDVSMVEFLIGGGFNVSGQTFLSNIFLSYGLLGVALIVVYFVALVFAARDMVKNSKGNTFLSQGVLGSLVLFGVMSLFLNFSMHALIVFFLLGGLLANLSAKLMEKEQQFEYLKFRSVDKQWQRMGLRFLQMVLIMGVLAVAVYGLLNVEEVFLS
ncbi:hypothetical protein GF389_04710 [Candidatus Dojkabacteria bacterium]|nr:hypothetical protein [Candidatus Dojkabacteria bacterium]